MRLLLARGEDELRGFTDPADRVLWLAPREAPESIRSRAVSVPADPPAMEAWLAIRKLGDAQVAGRSVKEALTYGEVSLWWFVHYWLVYGHGLAGWAERYRTLRRVLAGLAVKPTEMVLLTRRAEDDLVARAVAESRGLPYRWAATPPTRTLAWLRLRWSAEVLFRVRMAKLILRGFLARVMRRNSLAAREHVDMLFNASSSTWDATRRTDRVLGPLLATAEGAGLTVAGLHLDHRRNLGMDTLRSLDRRIVSWESLVTPGVAIRSLARGRRIARAFGGPFPGDVLGLPAQKLLADRLPVLFGARLADAVLAIDTASLAVQTLRPGRVYITDGYDLWGRAIVVGARRAGIQTLEVQHGIIQQSHGGYLHLDGEVAADHSQHSPYSPLPDHILVHGEIARDALVRHDHFPAASVHVTGSPQVQAARRRVQEQPQIRSQLGLATRGVVVLYFGAPYHVYPADADHLRAFLNCCRADPQLVPVLRPHPLEGNPERYRSAAAPLGAPVLTRADPFELILASDVVISHNSTTALDAMVLGRPVIHVNMSGGPDLFPFVDEAGAIPARSEGELREALERLKDPAARTEVARRHAPYANAYFEPVEDPAQAMLDVGFSKLVPA